VSTTVPVSAVDASVRPERPSRIVALDILRGFALCGMVFVHVHQRMELPAHGVEHLVSWIELYGVQTKAWALFAFLFGAGFAILMRNAESSGKATVPMALRRLLGLAVIGIAVLVISGYDILLGYAVWGLPLLVIRKWPTRWLITLAIASALAADVYGAARSSIDVARLGPAGAARAAMDRTRPMRMAHASIPSEREAASVSIAVKARLARMRLTWSDPQTYLPGANLVLYILGLLAVRQRIFEEPKRHLRIIGAAMTFGFLSWAIAWWMPNSVPADLAWRGVPVPGPQVAFGLVREQWLALTYAGATLLPRWSKRLSLVAAAGRMTLTNFTLHAIMLAWLAPSYGLSLRLRPYGVLAMTLSFFLVVALMSQAWLSRFEYGPLEYLWRMVTYARWQPLSPPRPVHARVVA
jgi:uncharacterized protein